MLFMKLVSFMLDVVRVGGACQGASTTGDGNAGKRKACGLWWSGVHSRRASGLFAIKIIRFPLAQLTKCQEQDPAQDSGLRTDYAGCIGLVEYAVLFTCSAANR